MLYRRCQQPNETKYTLDYYVKMALELEKLGCHSIAIKDMAALLKPRAAKELVGTLKKELHVPLHLHTHDSTGNGVSTVLMAAEAGVDIVDLAIESMVIDDKSAIHECSCRSASRNKERYRA